METAAGNAPNRWADAWPDALALAGGLAVAWWAGWATPDLVWSLWLSSLVVGYAMIVWTIFGPAVILGREAAGMDSIKVNGKAVVLGGSALLIGGLFLLAFFTVHFGMFHFVHSVFLKAFLPIEGYSARSMPGLEYYWEVFRRYWFFLPMAFLAERQAFRLPAPGNGWLPLSTAAKGVGTETDAHLNTAVTAEAIADRKARNAQNAFGPGNMMAPYKNVVRMHLLIFFFAFAHFAKLESFLVYAVVYAAYFFPWRLLKRDKV